MLGAVATYLVMALVARYVLKEGRPEDDRPASAGGVFHPIGPEYEHRRRQVFVILCNECGQPERVPAVTEETVGNWGEKILCSACKEKVNAGS